jgi:hypothetical protein
VLLTVNGKQLSQFLSFVRRVIKGCKKNQITTNLPKLQNLTLTYVIVKLKLWKEKDSGFNL